MHRLGFDHYLFHAGDSSLDGDPTHPNRVWAQGAQGEHCNVPVTTYPFPKCCQTSANTPHDHNHVHWGSAVISTDMVHC